MAGSSLVAAPSQAEEPDALAKRLEELRAQGLGQLRDHPVPVPDHLPRLNDGPRPTEGGVLPPWIVFVNFDGATLTGGGDSAQDNITQITELAGEFAPYGDAPEMKAAILQAVGSDFVHYNIDVVDTRPEAGEYAMTLVGPTNPFGGGVLGIAPVDCANMQTHSNVSFAFHSAGDGFDATTAAATISHEQGHAFGLDHVDDETAILNPYNAGGDPTFVPSCLPLTNGGGSVCSAVHEQFCPGTPTQNSHEELLALFGPAIPDLDGPVVIVTAPLTGTVFQAGDSFTVIVTITDDSDVAQAELYSNGMPVMIDTLPPWGWQINNVQPGLYTLEVVAHDEHGNEGLSTPISILVEGDGVAAGSGGDADESGGTLDGGTASEGGDTETAGVNAPAGGCGCTEGAPPSRPWLTVLPLLGLLGLRRRATTLGR